MKGFYIPANMKQYSNAKKGYLDPIREIGKKGSGLAVPLDIELVDLKFLLQELSTEKNEIPLRWLCSQTLYRNQYPKVIESILAACTPPNEELLRRITKDVEKIDNKGG